MHRHLFLILSLLGATQAPAVMVYDDDGPTRNLTDPGDGDIWDLSGSFQGFVGTAIGSKYFITADHATGNGTGGTITFASGANAGSYTTVARYADPDSDLEIWEISGAFNSWVPLWDGGSEVGQTATLIGKGRAAGAEVVVGSELKGWKWGTDDQAKSWGRNEITGTAEGGKYLAFDFDAIDGVNEGGLAERDSGGGLFLYDALDAQWELAGVHYAVDGPFRESDSTSGEYNATLFDMGGLYVGPDDSYTFVTDTGVDKPAAGYSTRISERSAWINSVIPEPGTAVLLGLATVGLGLGGRSRRG